MKKSFYVFCVSGIELIKKRTTFFFFVMVPLTNLKCIWMTFLTFFSTFYYICTFHFFFSHYYLHCHAGAPLLSYSRKEERREKKKKKVRDCVAQTAYYRPVFFLASYFSLLALASPILTSFCFRSFFFLILYLRFVSTHLRTEYGRPSTAWREHAEEA